MPDHLPIRGLMGSMGTVFLTGGATLDHLKDGEHIVMAVRDVPADSRETAIAVRELQQQHTDLHRLVMHHTGGWQCVEPCIPGKCLACDMDSLEDRWRVSRADRGVTSHDA
jgi:hypothetical protein